jgi:hypothetical protein
MDSGSGSGLNAQPFRRHSFASPGAQFTVADIPGLNKVGTRLVNPARCSQVLTYCVASSLAKQ